MATKVAACLRMIANGRTQVTVQALAVLNQALSAEELGNRLNVLPHSFGEMKFTLLLSKNSPHGTDFLEKFDATLEKMIADGSYADLVNRLRTGTYR